MIRKIAVITGTRAEYGLLYPLVKRLEADADIELSFIVTGGHLLKHQGETVKNIERDNIKITQTIDMEIVGDDEQSICKSISVGIGKFSELFSSMELDAIIVLGDRYELLSVCIPAVVHKIPIIHIHGGEVTKGAIDDAIRHSITKMAAIHFPTIEVYGKRIIQMGENPKNVHVVGALGIDNIDQIEMMTIEEIKSYTAIDFESKVALMTYHPVTLDKADNAGIQMQTVLEALIQFELLTLITMPNTDTGSDSIYQIIDKYTNKYPEKFRIIKNLGQRAYLSAMKYSSIMIGNSSSGIIESSSFKIPVVNIGDRQEGRYKPENIIDCKCSKEEIIEAIYKAMSDEFREGIKDIENPYGDGKAAERIINIIKETDFTDVEKMLKKGFYELY